MVRGKQAEVLSTETPQVFALAVGRAAELLRAGEVVALPTETVYGLAANALDPQAVKKIFRLKGRPGHNPIIVHVASLEMAQRCVRTWPLAAARLAEAFWPGPLTLVLPKASAMPSIVTAGGDTVGIRWSRHPFMQAVLRECDFPLAAPSANRSSQLSPTNADHVVRSLGDQLELIVDGGQAQVGIESTVLDLCVWPPRILRPGMIPAVAIASVMDTLPASEGQALDPPPPAGGTLRSPGLLERHYSPHARLVVWRWTNDPELRSAARTLDVPLDAVHVVAHTVIPLVEGFGGVSVIPHDAEAFARALYQELHRCDEASARVIVVEAVPETAEWQAVADRLRRAAVP